MSEVVVAGARQPRPVHNFSIVHTRHYREVERSAGLLLLLLPPGRISPPAAPCLPHLSRTDYRRTAGESTFVWINRVSRTATLRDERVCVL